MKKDKIFRMIYQLASPILLMVVGLILILNPDTASVLVAKILGWVLSLIGIGFGVSALLDRDKLGGKVFGAIVFACAGGFLSAHPLLLAAGIGRILGIVLAARGLRDVFLARQRGHGQLLAGIETVAGVVLVMLPMTTSRLVFSICGVVILMIGVAMLIDRLRDCPRLDDRDPDIIDVEKV